MNNFLNTILNNSTTVNGFYFDYRGFNIHSTLSPEQKLTLSYCRKNIQLSAPIFDKINWDEFEKNIYKCLNILCDNRISDIEKTIKYMNE